MIFQNCFTRLKAREITYNNFEISLVVFMPNITTNHAITSTNRVLRMTMKYKPFYCWVSCLSPNNAAAEHTLGLMTNFLSASKSSLGLCDLLALFDEPVLVLWKEMKDWLVYSVIHSLNEWVNEQTNKIFIVMRLWFLKLIVSPCYDWPQNSTHLRRKYESEAYSSPDLSQTLKK